MAASIRPVGPEDCQLLRQWANAPVVREASFNTAIIALEDHIAWFTSRIKSKDWQGYVVCNENDIPIGQVRLDVIGHEAQISVSIGADFRGRGYGSEAIHLASVQLFRRAAVKRVNAYIKWGNSASMAAFAKANYKVAGVEIIKGHLALRMVLERRE